MSGNWPWPAPDFAGALPAQMRILACRLAIPADGPMFAADLPPIYPILTCLPPNGMGAAFSEGGGDVPRADDPEKIKKGVQETKAAE